MPRLFPPARKIRKYPLRLKLKQAYRYMPDFEFLENSNRADMLV